MDWFLISSFLFSLSFGFLIIIDQPYEVGLLWLILSCLLYLPQLYLPHYLSSLSTIHFEEKGLRYKAEMHRKSYNLSLWLVIMFPMYPIVYIIALCKGINAAQTIAIYQILSVITKAVFLGLCMDGHQQRLRGLEMDEEQRANEARRDFMKYIFHEVRNPLNSFAMGIEVLERSSHLDESDVECLTRMKEASTFMTDTLNDVLSMQKIEEGKLELDIAPFSIVDSVHKVISTLSGAVTAKKITVLTNFDNILSRVVIGDRYRIEHVVSNLLSNAIKFSPAGKTITIKLEKCESLTIESALSQTSTPLKISVIDQGPGISKENQKKLFKNFVQIRPNTLQEGQGSGLGLALCKQIVTLHGGVIDVESEEGIGSTFYFTIPFKKCQSSQDINVMDGTFDARKKRSTFIIVNEKSQSCIPPVLIVDGNFHIIYF
jgi:signal transduction histidine kinase